MTKDPVKRQAAQHRYKARHRDRINARKRAAYHADVESNRARQSQYRKENRESVLAYNRKWSTKYRRALRAEFIAAYGGCCSCCGEQEQAFLQLDHIHNDGAEERRQVRNGTRNLAKLKRLGWPKDRHQLLCANCNFGKQINGGICPHKS